MSHTVSVLSPLSREILYPAVFDCSWLLSRGYPPKATLQLVGDRYNLDRQQRIAVSRSSASELALKTRQQREVLLDEAVGFPWEIDVFNLLVTLEVALEGKPVLLGLDGCCRDLASMHGRYRTTELTEQILDWLVAFILDSKPLSVRWLLDKPVSQSGRLAGTIRERVERAGLPGVVELVADPDPLLKQSEALVITSDSAILDACQRWGNLAWWLLQEKKGVCWVDLRHGVEE